jgi:hypothetical protein
VLAHKYPTDFWKLEEIIMRLYEFETKTTYHGSPLPYFTGNKKKDLKKAWDLYHILEHRLVLEGDGDVYDKHRKLLDDFEYTLTRMEKGSIGGNNADAKSDQFYVSSVPEFWMSIIKNENLVCYDFGGVYELKLNKPISYYFQSGGGLSSGTEQLIKIKDVASIIGPYYYDGDDTDYNKLNDPLNWFLPNNTEKKQKSSSYDVEIDILKKLKFKNIKQLGDKIIFGGITPRTENIRGRDYLFSKAYLVRFDNKKYTIGYVPDDRNMQDLGNSYSISFDNLETELQKYK